jgi:tetratricopeptide (TPR) repeat protein
MRLFSVTACGAALLGAVSLRAQDPLVSEGYDHFYNLEYGEAIAAFTAETGQHPDDPNAWNHLAHATLFRAMYRGGALESELVTGSNPFLRRQKVKTTAAEHQQFYEAIDQALDLAQTRLAENEDDPRALEALGVAFALRANYNFLVRKVWVDALHDATDARKAHKRLIDLEPDNVDARMIPAIYDYVTGSLPLGYRILGFLAGYRGDRNRGIESLQSVAQDGKFNRVDAEIMLAAIYRRERRAQDAIPLLEDLIQRFPRNFLLHFEIVQMYSDLGDKTSALAEIGRIRDLRQNGAPGFAELQSEKIDYLEGNLLFWYSDLDQALDDMKKVTAKTRELDLNTGIMSWMRLGQIYDLKGRRVSAVAAYKKAVAMAPLSEVGRESRRYVAQPYKHPAPADNAQEAAKN